MNLKNLLALLAGVLCALAMACQPGEHNPTASDVIRVGIVTSLTGAEAKFGQAQMYGYEMALEEINSGGGVLGKRLELVYQDDTSKDEAAMTAVDKLTEDPEILAIIGAYKSSATFPASAVANRYRVPMLVPSAITDEITRQGYEWVFRVCAPASAYGRAMVDFLTKAAAVSRLAVVYENTQFGSSVARAALEQAPRAGI
ncbi:MAG TPA: ABC transporter substrate-binding protein, partial [Blastocatellia bacterium]|nr:ABC transporter substrate-binding protein [Blastocatellia bacterium]